MTHNTILLLLFLFFFMASHIHARQQVPCMFIFGDSLVDNGNNNGRATLAVVNYPPYGIDYPYGPTGRFTNGKNVVDFIADFLGFDNPIPPFATAFGVEILKGVNYASGGAGILDKTGGSVLGDRITFTNQLLNHKATIERLTLLLGAERVDEYLNKCLYILNLGNNEYLETYIHSNPKSIMAAPDQFAARLLRQYSLQVKVMYGYGARKVAAFGIGRLGCVPQVLGVYKANASGCFDNINQNVEIFNNRLKLLMSDFNNNLDGAKFTFLNITGQLLGNLSAIGIKVRNSSCCKVVGYTGLCIPLLPPCPNRDQYVFYDNYHPSQIINKMAAERAYKAVLPSDAYPFDLQQLAKE